MPIMDANIYQNAYKPTVALQDPTDAIGKALQMKGMQQQQQARQQEMQDAADFKSQYGVSPGMAQARQKMQLGDMESMKTRHEAAKMELEALNEFKDQQWQTYGQATPENWPQVKAQAAANAQAFAQSMGKELPPGAGADDEEVFDPAKHKKRLDGLLIFDKRLKLAAQKLAEEKANEDRWEKVETSTGFARFNRKTGEMVHIEGGYKPPVKQPLVQVGYTQPFEVTDPETGKAKLVQQDKAGNIREVAKYSPKGGDKPMTEAQGNAFGFGVRARDAHKIMSDLETKGVDVGTIYNKTIGEIPLAGNYTKTPEIQKAEQAQRNFITAVLRKESGAAISAGEFKTEALKYFPQPGDSDEVKAQKREARERAVEVLQIQSGRDLPEEVKKVKDAKPKTQSSKVGTKAMLEGWMRDNPGKTRAQGKELMKVNGYSTEGL